MKRVHVALMEEGFAVLKRTNHDGTCWRNFKQTRCNASEQTADAALSVDVREHLVCCSNGLRFSGDVRIEETFAEFDLSMCFDDVKRCSNKSRDLAISKENKSLTKTTNYLIDISLRRPPTQPDAAPAEKLNQKLGVLLTSQ